MPASIDICYEYCTGCRACQMACAVRKEGLIWPDAARIYVLQDGVGPLDIPVLCHQCSDHPCIKACPPRVQALICDAATGVVKVDISKCLRARGKECKNCARACPGNTIRYHPESGLPLFCDLCDGSPACVAACASQAIVYNTDPSFDGKCYARPVNLIAADLALRVYGKYDVK